MPSTRTETAPQKRFSASRSAALGHKTTCRVELLEAMVASIHHNHVPRRVKRQAGGAVEAAVLGAGTAPAVEERPILGEALHVVRHSSLIRSRPWASRTMELGQTS